jgi:asparagine synthetase B (glutamine-hydrolysing)
MCGIFAYRGDRPPQAALLEAAALAAGRRGPHGCGWSLQDRLPGSSSDERYILAHERWPGPFPDYREDFLRAIVGRVSPTVLGHARLATMGDWRDINQLQPVLAGAIAVAHNGVIANPDELWPAGAPTDSIALGYAYADLRTHGVGPVEALDKLMAAAEQTAWAVVALDLNGHLYAHRRYHPLYMAQDDHNGWYLSSQRFSPRCVALPENTVVKL